MSKLGTFKGWHSDPSLWREIYAMTIAGVSTLVIGYGMAAIGGLVSAYPLIPLAVVVFALTGMAAVAVAPMLRPGKRWRVGVAGTVLIIVAMMGDRLFIPAG